uniref:Ig-like domain-containing protein n=1 Tax=Crocodylus porosus TaxID=8502 RepID=A0A7M4E2B7_CROPO
QGKGRDGRISRFSVLIPFCPYCIHPAALPTLFTKELKNEEATEGKSATLRCELNKATAKVEWKKGHKALRPTDKQEGATAELTIRDLHVEDTGDYTCVCGDQKTSAVLTVHGNQSHHVITALYQRPSHPSEIPLRCIYFVGLFTYEHDSGHYTCICGNQKTTASLTVHGNRDFFWAHLWLHVAALDIVC